MNHDKTWQNDSKDIEAMVWEARNYVRPSDDLRPDTMQMARDLASANQAKRNAAGLIAVLGLFAMLCVPLANCIAQIPVPVGASADEIQLHASAIANDPSVGSHWAMVEAFTRMRGLPAIDNRK